MVVVVVGFLPIDATVAAFAAVTINNQLNQIFWFIIQEFVWLGRRLYTNHWNKTLVKSLWYSGKTWWSLVSCLWITCQGAVKQWGISVSCTMTVEQHAYILQHLLSKTTWCRAFCLSLQWQDGSQAVEYTPIFPLRVKRQERNMTCSYKLWWGP